MIQAVANRGAQPREGGTQNLTYFAVSCVLTQEAYDTDAQEAYDTDALPTMLCQL